MMREGHDLVRISQWTVDEELSEYRLTLESSGQATARGQLTFLNWWACFFKGKLLAHVRPVHIEQARRLLLKGYAPNEKGIMAPAKDVAPRAHSRVNRYTDWLRHVLNVARRHGRYKGDNPVMLIERYAETRQTPTPYTAQQYVRVIEELGEQGDWFRLAILTNMRQKDQFSLRREQVFLDRKIIVIPRPKNKKPRIVHLSDESVRILSGQLAQVPAHVPWVFPGSRRRGVASSINPINARWWYKTHFIPACRRAGVMHSGQLWHSARDTFASMLAELGYREHVIMSAGGWDSPEAVLHYMQIADPITREAMQKLSQLVSESIGTVGKLSGAQIVGRESRANH